MPSRKALREIRLGFDYRVVMAMAESSPLIQVEAFADQHDLKKRRRPITDEKEGGSARYYLVHYDVRSLVGRGKYHEGFDVTFDLVSMGTYPEERGGNTINAGGIIATCTSHPIPWSPHFLDGVGTICLGSIWQGADHTLLGHGVIHVAKLLNWDEPKSISGGWNPAAVKWWKNKLGAKPLTPGLAYPALPLNLTHGATRDTLADEIQIVDILAPQAKVDDGFSIIASTTPILQMNTRRNDRIVL